MFNLTNITGSTNYLEFMQGTNALVDNTLGLFVLMMVALVFFISLLKREVTPGKAFAASSWVTMFTALGLKFMGLIAGMAFWVCLLLPGVAIMLLFFGTKD